MERRVLALCDHLAPSSSSSSSFSPTGSEMATLSAHALNTASGKPASGLPLVLSVCSGEQFQEIHSDVTNEDGRAKIPSVEPGHVYRVRFDTTTYFEKENVKDFFFPYVDVVFHVKAKEHHHIPLLLSPFGFTTYRGS